MGKIEKRETEIAKIKIKIKIEIIYLQHWKYTTKDVENWSTDCIQPHPWKQILTFDLLSN